MVIVKMVTLALLIFRVLLLNLCNDFGLVFFFIIALSLYFYSLMHCFTFQNQNILLYE